MTVDRSPYKLPLEVEAKRILAQKLAYQPALTIWFTSEFWIAEMEPTLEKLGYLGSLYYKNGFYCRDILPKCKELLSSEEEPS